MKIETIKEKPDYQKINNAFIVNRNNDEYKLALMRRKRSQKQTEFEQRLSSLEDKLDTLIQLMSSK